MRSVAALADESSGTGSRPLHAAATRAKGRANGRAIYSSSSSRAKEKVNETDASSFFSGLLWLVERLCPGPAAPASRYSPTHRDARENPHGGIGPTSEATNRTMMRLPALVQIGNKPTTPWGGPRQV